MSYVSTGSKVIDTVFPGGFPAQCVSTVFSAYDVGKTFLAMQTACHLWSEEKKPTLYVDTEKMFVQEDTQNRFKGYFKKRWRIEDEPQIDYVFPSNLMDLVSLVGKGLKLVTSEGQAMITPNLWSITDEKHSPLYLRIKEGKYGLLFVDSLTEMIKNEIPVPPRQNFPCRSSVESCILGRLAPIAIDNNIPVIVIVHETRDPANVKFDTGSPSGGSALRFHSKHMLQIRGTPGKEDRTIMRYRYPGLISDRRKDAGLKATLAKDFGYMP